MNFRQWAPSDILKPYIRHYYVFESASPTAFTDIVFPSGDMEMIFNLGNGIWESAAGGQFLQTPPVELWGQITRPLPIRSKGSHTMLGVKFFPHSAAYFITDDLTQFNDHIGNATDVIGPEIKSLHGRLMETKELRKRLGLLETFLTNRLNKNEKTSYQLDKVNDMLRRIKKEPAETAISRIASDHNITPRYLQKLVARYTGLSPKTYNKIARFQLSLKLIGQKEQPFTSIAYECGYFDQSHFIRDFKSFTGLTPSAYRANITPVNQLLL
jgi:AraC-like DNA-binding protein